MFGLREAGILGASVVLAGGVAYVIWNYLPSPGQKKRDKRPGEDGKSSREEDKDRREEPAAEGAVAAVGAQNTSTSRPAESGGTQVLVLGLDGAGKTSLLCCLSTGVLEQDIQPTQGFNAVSISKDNMNIEFLEIGGKEDLRPYWQNYMSKALLLVFVVDSSNPELFPAAKKHLVELLASRPGLPLMVLANKQDLPGSRSITDLHDALGLSEVGERQLFLIGTHVRTGQAELSSGVRDARDMIIQMVCDGR
ncbi:ADP-ribosylation factor-like protein 9 [Odontesthes bonariensis]|uniref:ADP-ribosylation factor-like protein 9 n=1 Tax=Odontesthes bonariensis TaxID=219752 RepID=UPI003F58622F